MLQVKNLHAGYGQSEALHGITFEAGRNETVAIMGRNGMGKTTLFKSLMGILPSTGGSVSVEGRDVTRDESFTRVAKGIAYVPFFPLGGFTPLQSSNMDSVAASLGVTPMQVAQAWLLHRSPNILLIAGTSKRTHLHENLSVAKLQLAPEVIAQLDSIGIAAKSLHARQ